MKHYHSMGFGDYAGRNNQYGSDYPRLHSTTSQTIKPTTGRMIGLNRTAPSISKGQLVSPLTIQTHGLHVDPPAYYRYHPQFIPTYRWQEVGCFLLANPLQQQQQLPPQREYSHDRTDTIDNDTGIIKLDVDGDGDKNKGWIPQSIRRRDTEGAGRRIHGEWYGKVILAYTNVHSSEGADDTMVSSLSMDSTGRGTTPKDYYDENSDDASTISALTVDSGILTCGSRCQDSLRTCEESSRPHRSVPPLPFQRRTRCHSRGDSPLDRLASRNSSTPTK